MVPILVPWIQENFASQFDDLFDDVVCKVWIGLEGKGLVGLLLATSYRAKAIIMIILGNEIAYYWIYSGIHWLGNKKGTIPLFWHGVIF